MRPGPREPHVNVPASPDSPINKLRPGFSRTRLCPKCKVYSYTQTTRTQGTFPYLVYWGQCPNCLFTLTSITNIPR